MKKLRLLIFTLICVPVLAPLATAQDLPKAEKRKDTTYYVVLFTRFKPGKTDEAREIIYDHFWPVDKEIGREVIPIDFMTGDWDHIVFFPLKDGPADLAWTMTPDEQEWFAAFVKREGGREKAEETFARFNDLVEVSKTEIGMTSWSAAD